MYVDEVFSGLDYSQFPKITVIENKMNVEEMVCVEGYRPDQHLRASLCDDRWIGQGRLHPQGQSHRVEQDNRLVRFFSQRPQVQERLTQQVLVAMQTLLGTEDVAVTISAVHYW